jgi:site-specific DNA-methyltransferase (adenine-specific)
MGEQTEAGCGVTTEVICGDCREVMPLMEPESFDLCLTDPCYGDTSLDWDRQNNDWIGHIARLLKPNGSLWVFGSLRSLIPVFDEAKTHGFKYSQEIIWEKQNGTGFHADRFRRVHEFAVLFYRGKWSDTYHKTQYTNDATKRQVRRKKRPAHTGNIEASHYVSHDGGPRMMRSVIRERNEHGRAIHPTQKPADLLKHLIKYSCPIGGRVIDPFAGSGSTAVAATDAHCNCVLIEINSIMADKAAARLREGAA